MTEPLSGILYLAATLSVCFPFIAVPILAYCLYRIFKG